MNRSNDWFSYDGKVVLELVKEIFLVIFCFNCLLPNDLFRHCNGVFFPRLEAVRFWNVVIFAVIFVSLGGVTGSALGKWWHSGCSFPQKFNRKITKEWIVEFGLVRSTIWTRNLQILHCSNLKPFKFFIGFCRNF